MRVAAVLVACLAVAARPTPGQEAAPPAPPVFGAEVDVVAVDASVVDSKGLPLRGLGLEEFRVEVDGRPRRVVSAEYVGRDLEPPAAPSDPASSASFSSNERVETGRLVLLLVDAGNIARGSGRHVFAAASRFVTGLPAADRVGLVVVPGPGPNVEFTADRDRVTAPLRDLVGQGVVDRGIFRVPIQEAVAFIVYRDMLAWERYTDVECAFVIDPQAEADCRFRLEGEAAEVVAAYRERAMRSRRSLLAVMEGLSGIEGPKTVVLISEGLWTETPTDIAQLSEAVARAQATLYVLLLEKPSAEAEFRRGHMPSAQEEAADAGTLYDLATSSRGAVLRATGTSDAPFARLSRELMGYYLLGFEPETSDRDGRSHRVEIAVTRPGASVRARRLLSIPAAPPSREELLLGTLRSPRLERELPVRVATFATWTREPGKVRLLITAQASTSRRPLSVGYVLSDAGGKVVSSRAFQGVPGGDGDWAEFVGEAVVEPGAYRLRLAVVDGAGRRGSVEHPARAALVRAGGVQVSDLVLGPAREGSGVRPSVDLELEGGGLSALVEVGGADRGKVDSASVAFELADSADGPAFLRAPVQASAPGEDGARVGKVSFPGGLLPPGEYTARAEVSVEGKPVAAVARTFRVAAPRDGGREGRAPLAAVLVAAPPFDRAALLRAETLLHYIARVDEVAGGRRAPEVAGAVEEARAGRPGAMADRLRDADGKDPRVEFLRGVSLYARGELDPALAHLKAALGRSSELFPAAVYMGACYAAGGRDLDAIGAWQTSLIAEPGSPALFAALGDALLRSREPEQAVSIVTEGLGAFPDDPALRRRLALAQAMAGRSEEALPLLTAWVDEHPEDNQALLATLALLFEGFSREAQGQSASPDTDRLTRYARAYVEGQGPNRGVVERWLRFLEERGTS